MVQLYTLPVLDAPHLPEHSVEEDEEDEGQQMKDEVPGMQQVSLEVSTAYHGYETYIEDGLICLKHKIRNLEKKKLKLKEYKKRLIQGEELNKDQKAAVEKFEEVLHNLDFARELHKTLDGLTQNLLKAQKKIVIKDQVERVEAERRRLAMVLKIHYLLGNMQQEHIQKDLMTGNNQAPHIPSQKLHSLNQLAAMLGVQRDNGLSLDEQMQKAALVYMDLLEGKDQPVAGSTYKLLKEEITRLMDCKYLSRFLPQPNKSAELFLGLERHSTSGTSKELFPRLPLQDVKGPNHPNWKDDFQSMKEQEPPDSWDAETSDGPSSPLTGVPKPWRGAAVLIPKAVRAASKQRTVSKPRKEKTKKEQSTKTILQMEIPVEIFHSPPTLPKDPILRKRHLEELMMKIHGSFSFMQDSLLDEENSTSSIPRPKRLPSGASSPLAYGGLRSPVDILPKVMSSTPLPTRLKERKASVSSGEQCLERVDLELSSKDLPHSLQASLQLDGRKQFSSPPLYSRELPDASVDESNSSGMSVNGPCKHSPTNGVTSSNSTPPKRETFSTPPTRRSVTSAQFGNIQAVFKVGPGLPQVGELDYKSKVDFSEPQYSIASTQTPSEFAPTDDEPQLVYQPEYMLDNGDDFLSSGLPSGALGRTSQSYYRGPVRGGAYITQPYIRDSGSLLYAPRDSTHHHVYRQGGRHGSIAAWSDSSQVSSPERDGNFTMVDSGHGDSMSVSTVEVPMTPHSHQAPLLPMHLYPLSQPMRVAFTTSRTANFAPGNLDQPIVFDQLHSNLGEAYDTHIGRFTCPVNGTYVFIFHILKLAINVPLYVNLMRNEEVMVSAYANDGAPDHETASNHAILPLFQGDQVWLRLHRGAIYGSTWKYSTFSGFLLYQD
uniref:Caprin family member 2 n=1 Tax=Oryzias sinensis TaxID=183150 RepID=A0A8C7XEX4_9TELE